MKDKYVAYVGSYTYTGPSKGITIYDVDTEKGTFVKRREVEVNNASAMILSRDKRHLYSIADEGIVTFDVLPDGGLRQVAVTGIRGMRGCDLAVDRKNRFLLVAGSHDGKITVMKIDADGVVCSIADGVFHEGLGTVAERGFKPHVTCVCFTPDEKYACAVDAGIDQIKVYAIRPRSGKLSLAYIIRSELDSGPRDMVFSEDGRFAYVMSELHNEISVYAYELTENGPEFTLLEQVPTVGAKPSDRSAATSLYMSADQAHMFCTNAGDNSVAMYDRDAETGHLKQRFVLPVSGAYPKDCGLFPGGDILYSVNHTGDSITFFRVDYEKGLLIMRSRPVKVYEPNRAVLLNLAEIKEG
ncbi:MAG: lactonase family protein [Lachnospiraceae bacterium]|nr:lactonase family protein [Lachnospiraceae bacterium]